MNLRVKLLNNPYVNLIRTIWCYGQEWRRTIVGFYVVFVFAQFFYSLSPYLFGRTIEVLQYFRPERLHEVVFWLAGGLVFLLAFWLLHGPARVVERRVALHIQQHFRAEFYTQLIHLPLKWHQAQHSGQLLSRLSRASVALMRFGENQFIYIEAITKFLTSLAFIVWISPWVGLMSLLTCILVVGLIFLFDRRLIPLYDTQNELDNRVGAVLYDYVGNMTTVLTLRLGTATLHHLKKRLSKVWPYFRRETVVNEVKWFSIMMLLTGMQSIILICYIVFHLRQTGIVEIGLVVMLFRYQWDLNEVFYLLSANYSELVRMNTDVLGIKPVLEEIHRYQQQSHTQTQEEALVHHATLISAWKEVHIQQMHYQIFDNFNLTLHRGEKIALIGHSGAGKSTLLNLLRGLYQPEHVKLTLDNVTFPDLAPLMSISTLIPQDPEIFENTLAFNISLENDIAPDKLAPFIQLAQLSELIAQLPEGIMTEMRERGANFSVGQRQRIALARGFLASAESSLILMDEPTSSLDIQSENKVLEGVLQFFKASTVVISLHRLYLLSKFDRIILLEEGKITADGPADRLLFQPGPVRRYVESTQQD